MLALQPGPFILVLPRPSQLHARVLRWKHKRRTSASPVSLPRMNLPNGPGEQPCETMCQSLAGTPPNHAPFTAHSWTIAHEMCIKNQWPPSRVRQKYCRVAVGESAMLTVDPAKHSDRVADGLALAVIGAVAVIAALTFRDYGLGWDDYTHAEYGGLLLQALFLGFHRPARAVISSIFTPMAAASIFSPPLPAKVLPFDLFETRRLVGAVIGVVGLLVTWRLGRRVGGPLARRDHGRAARDLSALLRQHVHQRQGCALRGRDGVSHAGAGARLPGISAPSPITCAMVGGAAGLAIGTRVLGGLAAINALAALAVLSRSRPAASGRARSGAARRRSSSLRLAPGLVLGYAVMALVWPWSVTEPLNPLRAVEYFSHFFEKPWKEMFDGVALPVPDMPRRIRAEAVPAQGAGSLVCCSASPALPARFSPCCAATCSADPARGAGAARFARRCSRSCSPC